MFGKGKEQETGVDVLKKFLAEQNVAASQRRYRSTDDMRWASSEDGKGRGKGKKNGRSSKSKQSQQFSFQGGNQKGIVRSHPKISMGLGLLTVLGAWGVLEARDPPPPGPVWAIQAELPNASDRSKPRILGALTLTTVAAQYRDITLANGTVVPGVGFQMGIDHIDPVKYALIMGSDPADPTGKTPLVPIESYTIDMFFNGLSRAGMTEGEEFKEFCEQEVRTGVESGKNQGDRWDIATLSGGKITTEQLTEINNIYNLPPFDNDDFDSGVPVIGYAYTTDPAQKIICEPTSQ